MSAILPFLMKNMSSPYPQACRMHLLYRNAPQN
jgi:hypothetical protein